MCINCERGNYVDSIGELTWEVKRHSNVTRLVGKLSVSLIKVHEMEEIASQGLVRWRGFQTIMFILQTKYCSMHIMGRDSTWWISPLGCNRIQLANWLSIKNQLKFLLSLDGNLRSNICPLQWGRTLRRRCNCRSCLFITKQNFSCTYPLFGRSSPWALGCAVCTNVVQLFEFLRTTSLCFHPFQNQRTVSSSSLKTIQNQITIIFGYFKSLKEPTVNFWLIVQKAQRTSGFHERTDKEPAVFGQLFHLFMFLRVMNLVTLKFSFRSHQNQFLIKFQTKKWVYTWVDNQQVSISNSRNLPTTLMCTAVIKPPTTILVVTIQIFEVHNLNIESDSHYLLVWSLEAHIQILGDPQDWHIWQLKHFFFLAIGCEKKSMALQQLSGLNCI